jgi:hypothetical protein
MSKNIYVHLKSNMTQLQTKMLTDIYVQALFLNLGSVCSVAKEAAQWLYGNTLKPSLSLTHTLTPCYPYLNY